MLSDEQRAEAQTWLNRLDSDSFWALTPQHRERIDHERGILWALLEAAADMQREVEWEYEATPDWKYGIRWTGKTLDEHLSNLERYSDPNGGWWYAEKEDKPTWITYQSRRRVKAGPWLPVTPSTPNQTGAENA